MENQKQLDGIYEMVSEMASFVKNDAMTKKEFRDNAVTKAEFNELYEVVSFIKDNAVTKTEFNELKSEVGGLKSEVGGLKSEVGGLKVEVRGLGERIGWIESNMVTKDYLDKKMIDWRGDLVSLVRKEDNKVGAVVNLLNKKKVFEDKETDEIKRMEPFPIV